MILDYLYYKLYRATLTGSLKDIPQYITPIYLGGLISANFMIVNAFLAKIGIGTFLFKDPKQGAWFTAVMIILAMLYYRKNKYTAVLNKYSHESAKKRKRGNAIVAVYVVLSFLLIFSVAFLKPGKL
ncbi:MAG: hypothetical protein EO766_04095 [Hydrotalea sp. AMD]|uniref:hypothetical protein n=1 Tax=Hydrotalea sp. AMD TaxID=2501297 RepID=UPI001026A8AD|nr:hypothetical protein [Hydrotalea sp. AMD]RWZ89389.1 MAG: hypothetical protein EO766_04095 [Hydrotalea sp. AMD]